MGRLSDGRWQGGDQLQIGAQGWEPRQELLRGSIKAKADDNSRPAVAGRYHLIDCPGCPLSHRVSIAFHMKGLGSAISRAQVLPVMGENGRELFIPDGEKSDVHTGARYLYELYQATDAAYTGRASTPVLWDKHDRKIVSNSYDEIFGIVNSEFNAFAARDFDFRPPEVGDQLQAELAWLGAGFTGAVYRCGFALDQSTYDTYAAAIARTVPLIEEKLSSHRYLLGDRVTEADLALLVTLLRYDAIYAPLFKCTSQRIADWPAICAYVSHMLSLPGVADTFDLSRSMAHYFVSHAHLNPKRIIPAAPAQPWFEAPQEARSAGEEVLIR